MSRFLSIGSKFDQERAYVIESLSRHLWSADARQFLGHDDLFVQGGAHAAVLFGPMRRDPTFARQCPIPGHQLRGRWSRGAPPQRDRQISLQPSPHVHAELGFSGRVTTEYG